MAKSKARVVEKFRKNIAAAGPEYEAGIASPKRSWSQAYKDSSDRMKAELARALDENRHVKGVEKTGDAGWAEAAKTKGSSRFTGAASLAAQKYSEVVDDVLAAGDKAAQAAEAMPNVTYEQRKQRALAAMDAIHDHWKKK